jgi:CDP-diglyceride synthetase
MSKNELVAGAIAAVIAYAIGWITISKQDPIPGLDQLSAVIVTAAVALLAFSYFKRNPL